MMSHCIHRRLLQVLPVVPLGARLLSHKTHHLQLGEGRSLAYQTVPGSKKPTFVLIPGFHEYTHMKGHKAQCLLRYCIINDHPCIVYDHECTGRSVGDVHQLKFSHWVEDAVRVVRQLTEGPVVLVGSSLGGWLSVIAATQLQQEQLHGLVLIAPALNYIWPYYHRYKATLSPEVRTRLENGDPHVISHQLGDAMLKYDLAEDSRRYEIDLTTPRSVDITCPVRIIHGLEDTEIAPDLSLKLANTIKSDDVDVIFRKNSDHQLETPVDLELFLVTLDRMILDNPAR